MYFYGYYNNLHAKIEYWGIFDVVTAIRSSINFNIYKIDNKIYFIFSDVDQVLSNKKSADYAFKNLPEQVSIQLFVKKSTSFHWSAFSISLHFPESTQSFFSM